MNQTRSPFKRTWVSVTWREEGFHSWPEAPVKSEYLSHSHRHMFHFKVKLEVEGENREVEFHDLLYNAKYICKEYLHLKNVRSTYSCEQMAAVLAQQLYDNYKNNLFVECWEDGECGAIVELYNIPPDTVGDAQSGADSTLDPLKPYLVGTAEQGSEKPAWSDDDIPF